MVEKTDDGDSGTGNPICSNPHNINSHIVKAMDAFLATMFCGYSDFMQKYHSKYHCCQQSVSPADWPLLARDANSVVQPATEATQPETQRPITNGVNSSLPSTSTASKSTTISNQNGDAIVPEENSEVDPENRKQQKDTSTPAPQPPPVAEITPKVVPRPCSVIRHVSSDSLASLIAPLEPSPIISPCSSVSPSPVPAPNSATNENFVDDTLLPPSGQPTSNVDSSTLTTNKDQPSLPEDDDQSINSTDTELTPENHTATIDRCDDRETSTVEESNLADQEVENEPEPGAEAHDANIGIVEKIKSEELDNGESPNTSLLSDAHSSSATNQTVKQNEQNSVKPTEEKDTELIDLTIEEEVTPPESNIIANDEVTPSNPNLHVDEEEGVTQTTSNSNDEGDSHAESQSNDEEDEDTPMELLTKDSRKRKVPGCTGVIGMMPKHWKKNIATPFISGKTLSNHPHANSFASSRSGEAGVSDSSSKKGQRGAYNAVIEQKTNTSKMAPFCQAKSSNNPTKKRNQVVAVSDSPPSSQLSSRPKRRPTLLPPKSKHDDSSSISSAECPGGTGQDDDDDAENGFIPALYPDVELRENQSQDNHATTDDDCVLLDDDSQQAEDTQLLPAPSLHGQSVPPTAQSSSAGLSGVAVPTGPPSEGSEKSSVSSDETIVDRASSGESNSSGEGEDPDIMIVEEDIPAATILLPSANSGKKIPDTTRYNQSEIGREAEKLNGTVSSASPLQQPINKDYSKFGEYRRHSVIGSSGKKTTEDKFLHTKQHESSLSCDDEDTENGSQRDQEPQMPVLRLPMPVSPSNENGNPNIEAPALIVHPGDRTSSFNEVGVERINATEPILNAEDRKMGGIGTDDKSDDKAERSQVVRRRSKRERKKSIKLNGYANVDEQFRCINGYADTDDEEFRNVNEKLEGGVISADEENDEESGSERRTKNKRWFKSEHKSSAKITIRSGKIPENQNVDKKQADYPFTQRGKKRGRKPKKPRRSDTDTEGGWRGPLQSSSKQRAVTDYYSSNDDEPLINKKVRTQSLSARGPRSGDNYDDASNQVLGYVEDNYGENLRDRQPIAGPSQRFYPSVAQPSTLQQHGPSRPDVPVIISLSDDDHEYVEEGWIQTGHGPPSNPADVSVYTERLSGVEDPDATTILEFQSEHGSQASTTTTAASLSSTGGSFNRRNGLKRGILVQCPKCNKEVSNHFLARHQRSNKCDRNIPRPIGGVMTDYENDSQTEAELEDDMRNEDRDQQQTKKRGRPRGSKNKMGKCPHCRKKMLQSSIRNHLATGICEESRLAFERGEQVEYNSQLEDSQTEDEGDLNEYDCGGDSVVSVSATSTSPGVRIDCPDCGLNMLKTSLRNHLKQNRCKRRSTPAAAATSTHTTSNTTNFTRNITNENDEMVEGSDGEQSQGYLTNKKRDRSCRSRVATYKCDDEDDDDDESFIDTEKSAGYDRVVSSPLPSAQQKSFDDCPYADCHYVPEDEKQYQYHTNMEHPPGEGYPCNSCDRVFIHRLNLEVHQKTHIPRFPFDATMVSYTRNPALQPRVVISNTEFLAARQALQPQL